MNNNPTLEPSDAIAVRQLAIVDYDGKIVSLVSHFDR
jgi:hypothetical protein